MKESHKKFKKELIELCKKHKVHLNINYMNQVCDLKNCYALYNNNDTDECYDLEDEDAMIHLINEME